MPAISLDRRTLIRSAAWAGGGLAVSAALPAWARSGTPGLVAPMATVSGENIALSIGHAMIGVGGREGHAIGINGGTPGPVIRLKEGQKVRLAVTNTLAEESSIHWHGMLVPFQMDGVPGVSFPGIANALSVRRLPAVVLRQRQENGRMPMQIERLTCALGAEISGMRTCSSGQLC